MNRNEKGEFNVKKITVVLLGVCVTSMTLTGVSAADFSDGDRGSSGRGYIYRWQRRNKDRKYHR